MFWNLPVLSSTYLVLSWDPFVIEIASHAVYLQQVQPFAVVEACA
jgi:hypothetical protein